MASRGVDEVLMPGQVAALQRRIEILAPEKERCLRQIAEATNEAAAFTKSGDTKDADRALKRAARLRTEANTVSGEMDTLRSLVAARMAQTTRRPN
jgi:hypothetical protein